MSDPLLPVPPEEAAGSALESDRPGLDAGDQPDVLPGAAHAAEDPAAQDDAAEDDAAEETAAADAAEPGLFQTPRAGDRLTAAELESDLDRAPSTEH